MTQIRFNRIAAAVLMLLCDLPVFAVPLPDSGQTIRELQQQPELSLPKTTPPLQAASAPVAAPAIAPAAAPTSAPAANATPTAEPEPSASSVPASEPVRESESGISGQRKKLVTIGYANFEFGTVRLKPEATKEMLRDGWLYTGDTGLMDEDGYVKFLGRTREMIKCSGFSVFPAEVEGLLYRHPAVKECAVIGIPDSYRGESPKAFVILKKECLGTVTESEMIEWCKENMAAYKRPKSIVFREELPKSSAGKLLKRVLVEEERAAT